MTSYPFFESCTYFVQNNLVKTFFEFFFRMILGFVLSGSKCFHVGTAAACGIQIQHPQITSKQVKHFGP